MVNVFDVAPNDLIAGVADKLKNVEAVQPPEWAAFVKTGGHKERPPVDKDWWYFRCAAILRTVLKFGPVGVSKLRTKYGGRKRRGVRPEEFRKGSGSVIRKALQQLEKANLVKQVELDRHKGRAITPQGKSLLDKVALELIKAQPKPEVKKEEPVKKEEVKEAPKKEEKKPKVKEEKVAEKKKEPEAKEEPKVEKKEEKPEAKGEPKKEEKKPEVKEEPKKEEKKPEVKEAPKKEEKKPEVKEAPKEEKKPEVKEEKKEEKPAETKNE